VFPKRAAIALSLTALALVLLVSFRTPTDVGAEQAAGDTAVVASNQGRGVAGAGGDTSTLKGGGGTGSAATPAPASAGGGTDSGGATKTIDGPTVESRYGPVQVEITVSGSQLTNVVALQLPDGDRHSAQISSRVQDMLASEALQAQSGSIDGVSGATYTSEAYAQSLQAALDAAGL
jgi:uncharacterized protein with FMN-binding domain